MKERIFRTLRPYLLMAAGLFIFAIGWTAFLIPSKIAGGGMTGVASIIYFATDIPVAISYFTMNILLLILGIRILGFGYGLKTVFGVSIVSAYFAILQSLIKEPAVSDPFLACVIGGIMSGIGTGTVFHAGGSTGGTDIIAAIINKHRNISPGRILLLCDFFIIGSSFFVLESLEKVIYGLTAMAIASYTVDLVLNGMRQSVQFFIFAKDYELIASRINMEMNRGVTILDGTGWYSQTPVKIIMVVARKSESTRIFRIVKSNDPNAFISQGSVTGVYGEGFDPIKA